MNTEVRKVHTRQEMDDFVRLPRVLFRGVPQFVPDLDSEVRSMFDPRKNSGLEFSSVQPFVAYQRAAGSGKSVPVGRIVGIVNKKANEKWQQQVVRFGMLDFIDDPAVSRSLLDAVAEWGRGFGMTAIQGPLGVTDFDKEGMLVEDFHLPGTMNTIWNPDYYPRHMEQLGYEKAVDWLQIRIRIPQDIPARYARVAQYAREQIGLRVVKLTSKNFMYRGRQMFDLFNAAYSPIFGFSELSPAQVGEFILKYIRLIDKQLMPMIVNDQDEMVGVAITMGSLTEGMQKAGGRLWPTGWWPLLKSLRFKREDHAEMLLIAVRPDYQGLGVNAMFFDDLIPIYNRYGFTWAETGPQLEHNVRELSQWKPLHPEFVKRRRCYQKPLQPASSASSEK